MNLIRIENNKNNEYFLSQYKFQSNYNDDQILIHNYYKIHNEKFLLFYIFYKLDNILI